jgi:hypothetical protein
LVTSVRRQYAAMILRTTGTVCEWLSDNALLVPTKNLGHVDFVDISGIGPQCSTERKLVQADLCRPLVTPLQRIMLTAWNLMGVESFPE